MLPDLRRQSVDGHGLDVWRIGDDDIELRRYVTRPVAELEFSAFAQTQCLGVCGRGLAGSFVDVDPKALGIGEFREQRQQQTAGSRPEIQDLNIGPSVWDALEHRGDE